jgi:hypothetical protein
MSNDDRLDRFLADQANAISLPPADHTGVARRGARRRNRRRGAVITSVVVLGALAVSVAVVDRDGSDDANLSNFAAADVTPSTYDWTVLDPESGLGYSDSSAILDDGSIYSLSTAPGQAGDGPIESGHLYRSTDGAEWGEVALPDGLTASSIAGSGRSLYALGTVPASSGGRDLVLAASQDGAATWQQIELPDDVTELDARFPDEVWISQPSVAALDADHVVAAVTVQSVPDAADLLPAEDRDHPYDSNQDGVTVYDDVECTDAQVHAETCPSPSTTPPEVSVDEAVKRDPASAGQARTVRASYTWAELGLDPELQALLAGRTYVYSSQDGERFETATLPDDVAGSAARAVATSAGYTLFVSDWTEAASSTRVLTSADGLAFVDAAGSPLPGGVADTGVLADRPAVAVYSADGTTTVRLGRADGSWTELPLSGPGSFSSEVAFGPLGLAAVVYEEADGDEPSVPHLVHTADGVNVSSVSLEDELGASAANVIGVSVTADAIFVRIGGPVDDDPGTPPVQRVLVGTPA